MFFLCDSGNLDFEQPSGEKQRFSCSQGIISYSFSTHFWIIVRVKKDSGPTETEKTRTPEARRRCHVFEVIAMSEPQQRVRIMREVRYENFDSLVGVEICGIDSQASHRRTPR